MIAFNCALWYSVFVLDFLSQFILLLILFFTSSISCEGKLWHNNKVVVL